MMSEKMEEGAASGSGNGSVTTVKSVSTDSSDTAKLSQAGVADSAEPETETVTFIMKCKSTNDISLPCFLPIMQMGSNSLQIIQFIILCIILDQNTKDPRTDYSADLGMGRFFVHIALCSICITHFGQFTRLQMRLSHVIHSGNAQDLVMRKEGTSALGIGSLVINLLKMFKAMIFSAWYLAKFYFLQTFWPQDHILLGSKKIPLFSRFLRWCGLNLEFLVMIVALAATASVVVRQESIMDILFNFSGIFIVLEFDDIVMSNFPKYEIPVTIPKKYLVVKEEDVGHVSDIDVVANEMNVLEPSTELGVLYYYGLILIICWASV